MSVLTRSVADGYMKDLENGLTVSLDDLRDDCVAVQLVSDMNFAAQQLRMVVQTTCREVRPSAIALLGNVKLFLGRLHEKFPQVEIDDATTAMQQRINALMTE